MATVSGCEPSPSLRHRPRQRTLAGLFDAISYSLESPAQPKHVHTNLEGDQGYISRTIILKDINAIQAFDDQACSRIVVNIQEAKRKKYSKASVNILYNLGAVDAPLQATSGYSLKRCYPDHQRAFFIQKHPLWLSPVLGESAEVKHMMAADFTPQLQDLAGQFEDQFRIVESSDINFIRRVAGQIAIEGH